MKILLTILTIASIISPGCSALYGIKSCRSRTTPEILKYADKYKIPSSQSYILDTSYLTFLWSIDTTQKELMKNHYQPLQVLYFNKSGNLVSYHINCYAGGFPNLKWNRYGNFDTFVPAGQTAVDTLLNFRRLLKFVRYPDNNTPHPSDFSKEDYNIVVYWNIFMGRQSKRLIKTVIKNSGLAKENSLNLIFLNNDDIYCLKYR